MAPTDDNTHRESSPGTVVPLPKRPKTLLQRISSGFSSLLPTVVLRKSKSKTNLPRPKTAPVHDRKARHTNRHTHLGLAGSPQSPIPQIRIPQLSEPEECSYDATTYFSFPSIEQTMCDCCGFRSPSRATLTSETPTQPCSHCRAKSPFSHLAMGLGSSHHRMGNPPAMKSTIAQMLADSLSADEGPRPVPTNLATGSYINPPRTSSLPDNSHPRLKLLSSGDEEPPAPTKPQPTKDPRPKSPKLHHLHLTPRSHNHPFVHRHEVDAHMAAIRAGSPSPLLQTITHPPSPPQKPPSPYKDFSRTVYYGTTMSSSRHLSRSHVLRRVETSSSALVVQERGGFSDDLEAALRGSRVYRRRAPGYVREREGEGDGGSVGTREEEEEVVGGMRLELKGGCERVRLRGGGSS